MKYIDADQIRAEIERLKSKYRHNGLWTSSFQSDLAMAKIESMNELLPFLDSLPEQPVEGLEEAAKNRVTENGRFPISEFEELRIRDIKFGAEWQKKQDQETIELAEDHAMLAGMNKMEQQMIEKAYDTIMQFDELNDLVPTFEDMQKFGFKEGDKVKVIILKEK